MHTDPKIAVSPGVVFQEIEGESVLLDIEKAKYFGLDAVGTRVFQLLQDFGDLDNVMKIMLAEYEVEPARLRADLDKLIDELEVNGLITLTRTSTRACDHDAS